MAVDTQYVNDDRGQDEVVSNQRTRAYVAGNPVCASLGGAGSLGTLWMTGTGSPTSFASGSGAQTLTAAMLGGGLIIHNLGANTNVTDTTDTAANIQTYMNNNSAGIQVGDILQTQMLSNTGTGTSVLTVVGGTGVTLDANGVGTISAGVSKTLNFRCTAVGTSPTFTLFM
jgi:hypothetical protein